MRIEVSPLEARVLGSLIEKAITTPEQYPLSLGALTHACNQKSSREPVMQLSDREVQTVVDGLLKKHLISDRSGFGSRVTKYQHRFCNLGFGSLEFTEQELGILCVLLLRGPQTPGELRTRTNRLCSFSDVHETESVLQQLINREDGPFVARLAREPGKRESRYTQLFSPAPESTVTLPNETDDQPSHSQTDPADRLAQLESLLLQMQEQITNLQTRIERLEE
ncbi:MAG: DUF480 domain-containing protein [Gammaproteobacteria bacterium]|nr:DUF480 domain-containing protein [Gammaproteobacteria bacterium]